MNARIILKIKETFPVCLNHHAKNTVRLWKFIQLRFLNYVCYTELDCSIVLNDEFEYTRKEAVVVCFESMSWYFFLKLLCHVTVY
jgi:hypothetical protein